MSDQQAGAFVPPPPPPLAGNPMYRIRTINGGYQKRREVELWIVPNGEPMPIPRPNSFPVGRSSKRR